MKCPNCGAEANGRFCSFCGSELPQAVDRSVSNVNNSNNTTNIITNIYYVNQPPSFQAHQYRSGIGQLPEQTAFVAAKSEKSKNTALLLCFFTGHLGGHHFYAGRWGMGILYLLTGGLFGFGYLINLIQISSNSYKDSAGLPITGKATWAKWIILIFFAIAILASLSGSQS